MLPIMILMDPIRSQLGQQGKAHLDSVGIKSRRAWIKLHQEIQQMEFCEDLSSYYFFLPLPFPPTPLSFGFLPCKENKNLGQRVMR